MKIKLKFCNGKINRYFYGKKLPKQNSLCYCLAKTGLDDACIIRNEDNRYYP